MKAKEYFEKYDAKFKELKEDFTPEDSQNIVKELLDDFAQEQSKVANNRHIRSNKAAESLINEFNNKWNSMCNMFEKKYGVSPVKYNGWTIVMQEIIDKEENKDG